MSEFLDFLGNLLSGIFSGAPAKSRWLRRVEQAFAVAVIALAALVLYRIYTEL
jgi:hypothetical protein